MRPQNGKRGRSRGRNKGNHNQLNRTLESNGPDIKIRGSAAHIHEKYLSLARDAHSSGDRVAAENYLQHAEHYHRLMMAAMPPGQSLPYQGQFNGVDGQNEDGDGELGGDTGEALPPAYQPAPHGGAYQQGRETREGQDYRDRRDYRDYRENREERDQPEPREPQGEGFAPPAQQQREGHQQERPDREQRFQDRRLNGRSRRVPDDRFGNGNGNGRPAPAAEENAGAAQAPPLPESSDEDSDEALA